jgi:microcystin-dependent protein
MAEPFLSEIRIMSFNFAPKGWAQCNGQLLPINQNQALFSLLGTTYGGDGRVNFGLPDLRGRVPVHDGNGHVLGERGGETDHTLTSPELPTHVHQVNATSAQGNQVVPTNNVLASSLNQTYRAADQAQTTLIPATIANAGGSQPHTNVQPYLTLNFCIALQGIFPSQT